MLAALAGARAGSGGRRHANDRAPVDRTAPPPAWTTRHPAPGDIGWVIERHGALYAEEYGFDHRFEALVAQVAGAFLDEHDPARERCLDRRA